MKQLQTTGIILARTDYGEADRILTVLTPDHGKLRLLAKGVRRIKSKLAGGIELFSISDITFMPGRREIGTLVSTRLITHYGRIVKDLNRTMLGYELIKRLNKTTEDEPESDYYDLLSQAFAALDDSALDLVLIELWFQAQLLRLGGLTPNLTHQRDGSKLQPEVAYEFDFESSAFLSRPDGPFATDDIKFLRLLFSGHPPAVLAQVSGATDRIKQIARLVQLLSQAQA